LRHAFPILDAADLLQEIGYSLTIGDRSGWLDYLGARWIQEARTQCHFDQPMPRHQAHESAQQSIAPRILEGKAVEGELDPPTEMLTTLIQRPVAPSFKIPLLACGVQPFDLLAKISP
jgi:hypothetical protein